MSAQEKAISAPADQLTPMEASLLFTQAIVLAFLTDIIKEVICKAESTRPPKVSISKIRYSAPSDRAFLASLRTKAARDGSISPLMGIIQTFPPAPEPAAEDWAVTATGIRRQRIRTNLKNMRKGFII